MEHFHSKVATLYETSRKFEELCAQHILPNADANITEFYNTKTQKLKRQYSWYFMMVRKFQLKLQDLHQRTSDILTRIDAHKNQS